MSDLNLALTIRLMDRATAPLRGIGRAMQGLGRRTEDLGGDLGRLKQQQGAIDAFRRLKERLDQAGAAMRDTKARAEGLGRELAQQRRRSQDLGLQLDLARREVDRLGQEMKATKAPSDALKRAFAAAEAQAGELAAELRETDAAITKLDKGLEQAREGARRAGDAHRSLAERTEQARRGLKDLDLSADRLADAPRDVTRRTREATEALARQAEQAAAAQRRTEALTRARERLGRDMMRAAGIGAAGYGMMHAGRMGLGLANTWMEFDAQMDAVASRLGASEAEAQALRERAAALGRTTAFTATQVGQGMDFLSAAGFSADAINTSIADTLNLALVGRIDLGQASDIASNILSAFKFDPDQMGRVVDTLTIVNDKTNVNISQLGESMKYVAPLAQSLGISMEFAAAQVGLLGNVGIQGSEAGTALRAIMQRLSAPTSAAAKELRRLGVVIEDENGNLLAQELILQQLAMAMQGMGTADRTSVLKTLLDTEAMSAGTELLSVLDQVAALTAEIGQGQGWSQRRAGEMKDNLKGDVAALQSAADDFRSAAGEAMDPVLRSVSQGLTSVLNGVTDWTKANPELTSTLGSVAATAALVVTGVGGLATAAGGVLIPLAAMRWATTTLGIKGGLLGTALRGLGGVMGWLGRAAGPLAAGGMRGLGGALRAVAGAGPLVVGALRAVSVGLVTTPFGWAVLAAMALAGAAYAIYQNWDQIGAWFQGKLDRVKAAFDEGLGSGLAALLAEFNPWRIVWDTWDGLLQWLFGIDLGELAAHWIETLREGFREALADLKAWLQDRIRDVVGFLPDWLQEKLGFTPGGEADGSTDERAAPDSEPDAQGQPVRVPSRFEGRQPYAAIPTPIDTAAMLDALKPVPAGGPAPAGAGGLKPFPMGPTTQNVDNSTVVSVTVPPGSDVSAIAAAVARELERRQRGALHDLD